MSQQSIWEGSECPHFHQTQCWLCSVRYLAVPEAGEQTAMSTLNPPFSPGQSLDSDELQTGPGNLINKRPKGICRVAFSRSHIRLVAEVEAMGTLGAPRSVLLPLPELLTAALQSAALPGARLALALSGGQHSVGAHFIWLETLCKITEAHPPFPVLSLVQIHNSGTVLMYCAPTRLLGVTLCVLSVTSA